jgi:hypothetical protein
LCRPSMAGTSKRLTSSMRSAWRNAPLIAGRGARSGQLSHASHQNYWISGIVQLRYWLFERDMCGGGETLVIFG